MWILTFLKYVACKKMILIFLLKNKTHLKKCLLVDFLTFFKTIELGKEKAHKERERERERDIQKF